MSKAAKIENYTEELGDKFILWNIAQHLKDEDGNVNFEELMKENSAIRWQFLINKISYKKYAQNNPERWNKFLETRQEKSE